MNEKCSKANEKRVFFQPFKLIEKFIEARGQVSVHSESCLAPHLSNSTKLFTLHSGPV